MDVNILGSLDFSVSGILNNVLIEKYIARQNKNKTNMNSTGEKKFNIFISRFSLFLK